MVSVTPTATVLDDPFLHIGDVSAAMFLGNRPLHLPIGHRTLINAILLRHHFPPRVPVQTKYPDDNHLGTRRLHRLHDVFQIRSPFRIGTLVLPPVIRTELHEHDIRTLIKHVLPKPFPGIHERLPPDATIQNRVLREAILQNIAVSAVRTAARREAVPKTDDLHILRSSEETPKPRIDTAWPVPEQTHTPAP